MRAHSGAAALPLAVFTSCLIVGAVAVQASPLTATAAEVAPSLVPAVQQLHCADGAPPVRVDASWRVGAVGAADNTTADGFAAQQLVVAVGRTLGFSMGVVDARSVDAGNLSRLVLLDSSGGNGSAAAAAAARAAGVESSQYGGRDEGYALAVVAGGSTDGGADFVVAIANTSAGAFWATQTLRQLLSAAPTAGAGVGETVATPPFAAVTPVCTIADWPALSIRGVELNGLGAKVPEPSFYTRVDTMVAHKGNAALMELFADVAFTPVEHGDFMLALQAYVAPRHIAFIPELSIGGTNPASLVPEVNSGQWARGEAFIVPNATQCSDEGGAVVDNGCDLVPVVPPIAPLVNAGFEQPKLVGWTVLPAESGGAVGSWAPDSTIHRSGNTSMKLALGSNATGSGVTSRLLSDPVAVDANRTYTFSIFWQSVGVEGANHPAARVVQLDAAGQRVRHLPVAVTLVNTHGSGGFIEGTATFVAEPTTTAARIYIGGVGSANGTLWVDDLLLMRLDSALLQVIRTSVTDVAVGVEPPSPDRNMGPSGHMFKIGQDFVVHNASSRIQVSGASFRNTSAPGAAALDSARTAHVAKVPGGALPAGATVYVWYDYQPGVMGHHDYDSWGGEGPHMPWPPAAPATARRRLSSSNDLNGGGGSPCFAEPAYYAAVNSTLVALAKLFDGAGMPLEYVELGHDELRGLARDSRALLSGKTNAQLLASSMNAVTAMAKRAMPGVTVLFWDDMLNPWQLYKGDEDNLQAQWYSREDRTLDSALELIDDKDIVWIPWFYVSPTDNARIQGSADRYDTAGFRWTGAPLYQLDNIEEWVQVTTNSSRGLGLIDTDWSKTFAGAVPTLALAWNPRNASEPLEVRR